MQLEKIIGQTEIKNHLVRSFQDNRISHAQMFLGPEGSGNLALAIGFAQYILCTNKDDDDACGVCASCQKIQKLSHPDLHFSFPIFSKSTGGSNCDEFLSEFRTAVLENSYLNINEWRNLIAAENKQLYIPDQGSREYCQKTGIKILRGKL